MLFCGSWTLPPHERFLSVREDIRGCCAGAGLSCVTIQRATTFCPRIISQHPLRYRRGGGAEGGGSRPCGGGVIPGERALLAWGIYLLESTAGTRAQDEKGEPDASTDADMLPARCSGPPAAAAGRNSRPELTESPPNSGAVRAQSADTSRRRLRPAGSSHEPALADGRAAAHVEDSAQALASPLPA